MRNTSQTEATSYGPKCLHITAEDRTLSTESTVLRTAKSAKEYFKEYCDAAALHGVRYFAEEGRLRIEKIFWVVSITLSLMGCTHLIMEVWHKWDTSPMIVSFARSATSIWHVPFPAVSICTETKSCQTKFNFTEMYNVYKNNLRSSNSTFEDNTRNITMLTDEELSRLEAVSLLCNKDLLRTGSKHMSEDAIKDLRNVTFQMEEMMLGYRWAGKVDQTCLEDYFKPVWSDEGLCFTFNMLDNSELFTETAVQYSEMISERKNTSWDLENGYSKKSDLLTFPHRVMGYGASNGLYILLRANESDLDYLCRGPIQGFKVLLHNPAEIPQVGRQYIRVPLGQEVLVAVKPSMTTTSSGLRDYAPHRRQCYLPKERPLRFFQMYTQKNCELECITNFTLNQCDCVSFYMPRTNETPICGPGNTHCTIKAFEESVRYGIRKAQVQKKLSNQEHCDCLPSCISLEYDAESSQADYDFKSVFQAHRMDKASLGPGLRLARIAVFFKDSQFISIHRSELYGETTFLADCGSLLGLFSGFSFISLIEILYFLTLRLWCRFEKRRRKLGNRKT